MRAQIAKHLDAARSSYWLVPSLMLLGAFLLSLATTTLDVALHDWLSAHAAWVSSSTPAGARALLSTIAGSMITVAGVTFSITIAAIAYASAQLGPRLLRNFMRDRSNQITLGTFVATFLYCLLVLRAVQGEGDGEGEVAFVPYLGVVTALALAVASLGVLIHFIHHVATSMQAYELIAEIGGELCAKLAELFPTRIGEAPEGVEAHPPASLYGDGVPVQSEAHGYITHLDSDGLLELAAERDIVIELIRRPGDFVGRGEVIARARGAGTDDDARAAIAGCFAFGRQRTQAQDALFLVQQLVEIAARALSTGVNDPFTANTCMSWLGSALIDLGRRATPSPWRYDSHGRLRVVAPAPDFEEFAAAALDRLRPYVARDRNAALHMAQVIGQVLAQLDHGPRRAVMAARARALADAARDQLDQDAELVAKACAAAEDTGRIPQLRA